MSDVLDVVIVAVMLWMGIVWLRGTRARLALVGLGILFAAYVAAQQLELVLTVRLFQGFFAAAALVLIVVFQDDLRRLFERIAVTGMMRRRPRPAPDTVDSLVAAVAQLARERTGALMVLPGRDPLDRYLEGGVHLRGRISTQLLLSIFDHHSDGHDGAVLIEGNEVARFAVHLPLALDAGGRCEGGTRHAAALGLAERSDALCIVVSEERGTISIGCEGLLRPVTSPEALSEILRAYLRSVHPPRREPALTSFLRRVPPRWKEGLAALGIAGGLWAVVVPGDALVNVAFSVPVEIDNLPEGFEIEAVEPGEVLVSFSGHRRDLHLANPNQVQVKVDALLVQLGRRTFHISSDQVEYPGDLDLQGVEPAVVKLRVRRSEPVGG